MLVFGENDFRRLSNFLQTHIFWKFVHNYRICNQINYRNIWFPKVIIILIMTAEVLFFNVFSEKDLHLNAVEQSFTFGFYYRKIFKTRSRWRLKPLRGWTEPLCPLCNWRYKDLSVSCDRKVVTLLPIMEKLLPYGFLSRSGFYRPHFITVAPL